MSQTARANKVSILSAVHNEERHLSQMIDSILVQTWKNWELVFVDDGSTDSTAEVLKEYASEDNRITIASTGAKMGKVAAFNLAFNSSSGDAIALLAGDDHLPDDSIERRLRALNATSDPLGSVAFTKLQMFWDDNSQQPLTVPRGSRGSRSGPGVLLGRTLANQLLPIPDGLVSDDPWIGIASELLASEIAEVDGTGVFYRVHAGNTGPRSKSYSEMSESLHVRVRAREVALERFGDRMTPDQRGDMKARIDAENYRYQGHPWRAVTVGGIPLVDRAALLSTGSPVFYSLRNRFYRLLSGWRRR